MKIVIIALIITLLPLGIIGGVAIRLFFDFGEEGGQISADILKSGEIQFLKDTNENSVDLIDNIFQDIKKDVNIFADWGYKVMNNEIIDLSEPKSEFTEH